MAVQRKKHLALLCGLELLRQGKFLYEDGVIYRVSKTNEKRPTGVMTSSGSLLIEMRVKNERMTVSVCKLVYCYVNGIERIPEGYVVAHKDGNKLNNRIENLVLQERRAKNVKSI